MVMQRNPLMSAICLIANFFCLAALYLLLHAQLLAVLEIVVYAGAIMVLVIFVIMLLNLGAESNLAERLNIKTMVGVALVAGLLLELLYVLLGSGAGEVPAVASRLTTGVGTVESMGAALFGPFLLPFEITSLLLLAAVIGAVILAKKRL
jgi:NADH-quinone oxidoreductase subunit J